ncbi:hypothetical protein [Coleofasciculus sp. F4-SAH-05]|uniref:hypothetical protein n=1 Tax=Coleofasciculus sp. F4-SAH-05 TaxID=3069525 RepID=UPI0032FCCCA5
MSFVIRHLSFVICHLSFVIRQGEFSHIRVTKNVSRQAYSYTSVRAGFVETLVTTININP